MIQVNSEDQQQQEGMETEMANNGPIQILPTLDEVPEEEDCFASAVAEAIGQATPSTVTGWLTFVEQ